MNELDRPCSVPFGLLGGGGGGGGGGGAFGSELAMERKPLAQTSTRIAGSLQALDSRAHKG
ncbi:uncharacterized, partial [Tachysurus ichikawai]